MNYNELTLLNIGLILEAKRPISAYSPDYFPPPYDKIIRDLKSNPEALKNKKKADQICASGMMLDEIELCHNLAVRQNGLGEDGIFDFQGSLIRAHERFELGTLLDRNSKKLKSNEEVDLLPIHSRLSQVINNNLAGPQPANTIDYEHYEPYIKSGIPYWDNIIGGWCTDGPIVVVAPQETGKSYFVFYATCSFLMEHPEKTACIYTLEMPANNFLKRSLAAYPQFKSLVESGRLFISATVRNVEELNAEIMTRDYGFVGIDHVGYLVKQSSAEAYEKVYKTIVDVCRFKGIPVMELAQPNRESKKLNGFLDIYTAGWSGEAENSASMFITLNRVDPKDDTFTDRRFNVFLDNPTDTPRYFICLWKDRNAFMKKDTNLQMGKGAIRIEPGKNGYYNQIWVGDAWKNKLLLPDYQARSGQKLSRRDE